MSGASSKTTPATGPVGAPWRWWQATLAALGVFLVAQLTIGAVLLAAGIDIESFGVGANLILGLFASVASFGLAWWFASWFGPQPLAKLGFVRPKRDIWGLVAAGMVLFVIASSIISSLVARLWSGYNADQVQDLGLGQPTSDAHYFGTFLLLVVAAPIVEEVVFRGILFSGWRAKGFSTAAIVSSTLFGLFHWQPNVVLATIVLGWIMAYIYEKTGSLWAPISLHALKNTVAFAIVYGLGIS